jgi:hypothetical protein
MSLEYMKKLTDPATKQSTAFYAALVASCLDAYHRGFHLWNVVLIGSLCGITVTGLMASILQAAPKKEPD